MDVTKILSFAVQLTGLTSADREVLALLVRAAAIMDDIFYLQVGNESA